MNFHSICNMFVAKKQLGAEFWIHPPEIQHRYRKQPNIWSRRYSFQTLRFFWGDPCCISRVRADWLHHLSTFKSTVRDFGSRYWNGQVIYFLFIYNEILHFFWGSEIKLFESYVTCLCFEMVHIDWWLVNVTPAMCFPQKQGLTPWKFNSSPLKIYRNPKREDRLPTIIFQGRAV